MTKLMLAVSLLLTLTACSSLGDPKSRGLGVALRSNAVLYHGSAHFCTSPATIDFAVVSSSTREGQEIQRDGVQPGSARYALLTNALHRRVVNACKKAAARSGHDLVVRSGDIADDGGYDIDDLTAEVIRAL